jgi:pyruvate dehydrogenase (quinone)
MSTPDVSVFMLRRLREWGIRRSYGYPGDGTNGLSLAFHEVADEVEFVRVRHEELAAFAACAHAKLTGEVGVCMATSGPGAVTRWWTLLDERAHVDAEPINPQLVFHELSRRLPDRAIVLADSGSATN